jgi:hypothetical protein
MSLVNEKERKQLRPMFALSSFPPWFTQNPLGAAAMMYAASVFGVLLYTYFEPQE